MTRDFLLHYNIFTFFHWLGFSAFQLIFCPDPQESFFANRFTTFGYCRSAIMARTRITVKQRPHFTRATGQFDFDPVGSQASKRIHNLCKLTRSSRFIHNRSITYRITAATSPLNQHTVIQASPNVITDRIRLGQWGIDIQPARNI